MASAPAEIVKPGILVPLPSAERGVAVVLHSSPDGKYLAYGNGTNVIVRSIENPSLAFAYSDHTHRVTCAKFSPTGKYVASGDASGRVRVWALTQAEHSLKYELPSIGGEVEDVAWDSESKRIIAVGGGSAKAKFFSWDMGSQLGEVIPHTKKNLTCDFKPTRPFKAVFGGEDTNLSFYGGPPFKYDHALKDHTNFVNCVRYAPNGSRFISVSSDKAGLVYDGEAGAVVGRLSPEHAHAGGIYSVAWSPDSTRAVTASGDKSVKVWDMGAAAGDKFPCVATASLGKAVEDMQQGVVWAAPELIVSLSLDGTLNFLAPALPASGPLSRVQGHQAPLNTLDYDLATGTILTGDAAGRVCVWRPRDEARTVYAAQAAGGADVATKRAAAVALAGGEMAVAAWDDKLRLGDVGAGAFTATVPLPGQPKGLAVAAAHPRLRVVVTGAAILLLDGAAAAAPQLAAEYGPTCVDVSADGTVVAVGGKDRRVHIYRRGAGGAAGGALVADGETAEFPGEISVVALCPADGGATVAAGDAAREVRLYATGAGKAAVRAGRWTYHTTRVTGLKWSPAGRHLASVSTDRRIIIWDPASELPKLTLDLAGPHPFAAVAWADENTLWTAGTDGVVVRRVLAL